MSPQGWTCKVICVFIDNSRALHCDAPESTGACFVRSCFHSYCFQHLYCIFQPDQSVKQSSRGWVRAQPRPLSITAMSHCSTMATHAATPPMELLSFGLMKLWTKLTSCDSSLDKVTATFRWGEGQKWFKLSWGIRCINESPERLSAAVSETWWVIREQVHCLSDYN